MALDTETALIRPAQMAPEMACLTWQTPADQQPQIEHVSTVEPRIRAWLEDSEVLFVGHNIAFDMAVIAERFPHLRHPIFAAYRANRVTDTMVRQQLLDIAAGVYRGSVDIRGRKRAREYSLQFVARDCAGIELIKDEWRLSYGEFITTPIERWGERARQLQEQGRDRLREFDVAIEAARAAKDKARLKALEKRRESIADMVAGDPDRAVQYPLDDARATLAVFLAQQRHGRYLDDQFRQTRAAFALHLGSVWGICTDADGVEILKQRISEERDELEEELRMLGLIREDGSRDTKAAKRRMIAVCKTEGLTLARTDAHFDKPQLTWEERQKRGLKARCKDSEGGPLDDGHPDCAEHVCLDAEACERTEDDVLIAYAERTTLTKQLTNDIPALERGALYPLHTKYGLAGTGRSTSSKPNIQNPSKREGFREAFVPRPGCVFIACDYPTLELYTLAQCCLRWLGHSKLAEILKSGKDPHLAVAATILQKSYEWCAANIEHPEVARARDLAKPANFGFGGGMGIPTFVASTRKAIMKLKGGASIWAAMNLTEERARLLKQEWLETYPEMREYLARAAERCKTMSGFGNVVTLFTNRYRGQTTFCATANGGFQALGADCAKNAAWLIAEKQYVVEDSYLFNSRTVAFVHDEFILEAAANEDAHDVANELADTMCEGANEFLPDVPIPRSKMKPALMVRWSKKAKPRFDDNGRLIPWAA